MSADSAMKCAAEYDELDVLLSRRLLRKLKAVADEIRQSDDGVLLVMVAEDDQSVAQGPLGRGDAQTQFGI